MRFGMSMGNWSMLVMKEHQEADSVAEEALRNVKTVASLGAERKFSNKYYKIVQDCGNVAKKIMREAGCALGGMSGSNMIVNALIYVFAVVIAYNDRKHYPIDLYTNNCTSVATNDVDVCFSNITSGICASICTEVMQCWYESGNRCLVGSEVAILVYAVLNSFIGIGNSFTCLQVLEKSRMSAAYFLDVIDHKDEMTEAESPVTPQSSHGEICFKDIDFKYASRDIQVLQGLNLTIRDNEMLGIVGESGCGKSTVLKLLMRLYKPQKGVITWNNTDVSLLSTQWLRNQISYVAQEPVLFSGTIRENIMYGREDCTEEEMIQAAQLVEADRFIRSFPKGYDTFVGELGTSLSGGQKQRIAIARALLRRPRVLILDEATSALDTQSEAIVQKAIEHIKKMSVEEGGSLSIVIVAHRLSSIRNCDHIVVMDEGHVVEEGTHDSLMEAKGVYAGLYESQENVGMSAPTTPTEKNEEKKSEVDPTKNKGDTKGDNVLIDEISKSDMKRIGFFEILHFAGKQSYLFWVGLIGTICRVFFPPAYAYASATIQGLFYEKDLSEFVHYGGMLNIPVLIAGILNMVGTYENWSLHAIVGEEIIVNIRSQCFQKLIQSPAAFFDDPRHLPSVLISRLSIDGRRIRDIIDRISPLIENCLLALFCLVLCFGPTGNWKLAIIAIILSPLLVVVEYFQNMIVFRVTETIDNELTKRSGEITDYLLNIHTIHAYNLERVLLDQIKTSLISTDRLTNKRSTHSALGQGLATFLPSSYMLITLAVGAGMVARGETTFTNMFVVMMAVYMCAQFIGINVAYTASLKLAQQSANNVIALLNEKNENEDSRAIKAEGTNGDIVFDQVGFAYASRPDVRVLSSVSFTIPQGKSVAFVGPSGCGKSTIISLIQRLYRPQTGVIKLAGEDVETLNLDWYRAQLGAVNQEPVLFSGTIRENLQLGVNHELSEEELEEACKQALCLDFINEMPDRFETDLGAVGKAVSGGQKQRLALARAILRKPSILLLDEATSALDSENQEKFLTALNTWRKTHPCTVITVAHRLSTIVDSDIIFVVHEGGIVASGTHEELLKSCDFYANLVKGQ